MTAELAVLGVATTPVDARAAAAELDGAHPETIVRWALDTFAPDRVAVVTALQAQGMVTVEMALRIDPEVRVVTVDTGRLPGDTYAYIDQVRARFGRDIEIVRPRAERVVRLVREHGPDPMYTSRELREECCRVRKVVPLNDILRGLDCWITGLRRGQSQLRSRTPVVEEDLAHGGIIKVNPVAAWSEEQVHAHAAAHAVPLHPLYAQGYRSIGCAPCTRAVAPGDEERAGRWWWEVGGDRECGIHRR